MGVGIIQNGEVVYSGGVGVKDQQTQQQIDEDTRFMIASNTKGMTTMLLFKREELGKINWHDPIVKRYHNLRLGNDQTTTPINQTSSTGFNRRATASRSAGAAWSTTTDMLKYIQNELHESVELISNELDGKRTFSLIPPQRKYTLTESDSD